MAKTVFITGTSSGIGRAAAELFAKNGWNVVATMRNPSSEAGKALAALPNVIVLSLDVTSGSAVATAVADAIATFGSIDALVNNAGYGLMGPLESAADAQVVAQFDTNLFGPIRLMQAVLPGMRAARSGVIVNVSSIGGRYSLPLASVYQSSKFALEGLSETLALELTPLGLRVKIVEPGFVETAFAGSMIIAKSDGATEYEDMITNFLQQIPEYSARGSKPDVTANVIYEAVMDDSEKLRYPAGKDAHMMLEERYQMSDEDHRKKVSETFKLQGISLASRVNGS